MTFKLPDFLNSALLNGLRHSMNAPLTQNPELKIVIPGSEFTTLERLRTGIVDISLDDVKIHVDRTLIYKGYRVLLYIRDINSVAGKSTMPKYHLAFCSALEKMTKIHRFEKYVVANGDSGEFSVNFINNGIETQKVRLNVCQNCLDILRWKGFDMQKMPRPARLSLVTHFSLQEFFTEYPRDLIAVKPSHTSDSAPANMYPKEWNQISHKIKMLRGSKCKDCGVVLTDNDAKFLHVHHRNGLKYDNNDSNLVVLCIACHAEQPKHGHIKISPEYKAFMTRYQR
ncbi:HNH endonuclease signature motif containing protein [Atlantibacter sp.]|uniref:HNH endonuclease signature motif containing protein n=1 Tax=Atlantibacter sp. TaxID=1903473 RepID=UPI0028AB3028|nr:HNH endonuclease signature motif containing protein [Atlantibacter sp.]